MSDFKPSLKRLEKSKTYSDCRVNPVKKLKDGKNFFDYSLNLVTGENINLG